MRFLASTGSVSSLVICFNVAEFILFWQSIIIYGNFRHETKLQAFVKMQTTRNPVL